MCVCAGIHTWTCVCVCVWVSECVIYVYIYRYMLYCYDICKYTRSRRHSSGAPGAQATQVLSRNACDLWQGVCVCERERERERERALLGTTVHNIESRTFITSRCTYVLYFTTVSSVLACDTLLLLLLLHTCGQTTRLRSLTRFVWRTSTRFTQVYMLVQYMQDTCVCVSYGGYVCVSYGGYVCVCLTLH